MLKLVSWNVNGWRAIERKGALEPVLELEADVYSFQEIKMNEPELNMNLVAEFEMESCVAEKKGYSGTMNLVSRKTIEKGRKISFPKLESLFESESETEQILFKEGRICPVEISTKNNPEAVILLLNVYFPNGGMGEERLRYKMNFYEIFLKAMKRLEATGKWQGLVICGDVNTAHEEIDLARPKQNSKNTGFLPEERDWVTRFLKAGYVDTYRTKNPGTTEAYSWWDYKTRARERNVGWRIDYFFVSESLRSLIKKVGIEEKIMGSDHAPISLELDF